jgi:hypothetical protein
MAFAAEMIRQGKKDLVLHSLMGTLERPTSWSGRAAPSPTATAADPWAASASWAASTRRSKTAGLPW